MPRHSISHAFLPKPLFACSLAAGRPHPRARTSLAHTSLIYHISTCQPRLRTPMKPDDPFCRPTAHFGPGFLQPTLLPQARPHSTLLPHSSSLTSTSNGTSIAKACLSTNSLSHLYSHIQLFHFSQKTAFAPTTKAMPRERKPSAKVREMQDLEEEHSRTFELLIQEDMIQQALTMHRHVKASNGRGNYDCHNNDEDA